MDKKKDDNDLKWYREPAIHYPLWFIFVVIYLIRFKRIVDKDLISVLESLIICGFMCLVSGVWGLIANMFLVRIVFLTKFIYDNEYIKISNIILIVLGVVILTIGALLLKVRIIEVLFLL